MFLNNNLHQDGNHRLYSKRWWQDTVDIIDCWHPVYWSTCWCSNFSKSHLKLQLFLDKNPDWFDYFVATLHGQTYYSGYNLQHPSEGQLNFYRKTTSKQSSFWIEHCNINISSPLKLVSGKRGFSKIKKWDLRAALYKGIHHFAEISLFLPVKMHQLS